MTITIGIYLLALTAILHSRPLLAAHEDEHMGYDDFSACKEADRIITLGGQITDANKEEIFKTTQDIPNSEGLDIPRDKYYRAAFYYFCTKLLHGTTGPTLSLLRNDLYIAVMTSPSMTPYIRRLMNNLKGYPAPPCHEEDVLPQTTTTTLLPQTTTMTFPPQTTTTTSAPMTTSATTTTTSAPRVLCLKPNGIANGKLAPDKEFYMQNDVVTYSCNAGFTLNGDSLRMCQNNGQWSGSQPSCVGDDLSQCEKKAGGKCDQNAKCAKGRCKCQKPYSGDGFICSACGDREKWRSCAQRNPATCNRRRGTGGCNPTNHCACGGGFVYRNDTDKTCIRRKHCP